MQPQDNLNEQMEEVRAERERLLQIVQEHRTTFTRLTWLTTALTTLLGSLLSLGVSAASVSSFIDSIHIRRSYVWFLGGILAFQTLLIFIIWTLKKRNRPIIKMREDLIKIYVSAINSSKLNPQTLSNRNSDAT